MTLLIINGNIPCCDCKGDTGIKSDERNLFPEDEVYCYSCSAAMMSEIEDDDIEPDTVRAPSPYPFPFLAPVLARSGIGFSRYLGKTVAITDT